MSTTMTQTNVEAAAAAQPGVKPAVLFRTDAPAVTFRQRFVHSAGGQPLHAPSGAGPRMPTVHVEGHRGGGT